MKKIFCNSTIEAAVSYQGEATFSSAKPMEADTISKSGRSSKSRIKKFLGFLLMVMIGFAACEGPMGPAGIDGIDGRDGRDGTDGRNGRDGKDGKDGDELNWLITDFTVSSEHWKAVTNVLMGDIFEYEFHFVELTEFIINEGAVVCYLVQNDNNKPVQTPLPYTFYGEDAGYLYSENYTCEIRPGYIKFIVKISDFDTQVQQPLSCKFHVVLMW